MCKKMQFHPCCCEIFVFLCAVCSLLTLTDCQDTGDNTLPTEVPKGSGLGGSLAPPPSSPACLYFDSRTNRSRECPLTSSCFAFIRRSDDGSFRVKRGCGSNCQPEERGRKIKVCCNTHLCNDHILTPDNFTNRAPPTAPPTLCYQSLTNSTCEMSTACFSRLTYLSDGSYQVRQGCTRGPECLNRSESTVVKECCTSHLCNTPLTPDPDHTHTTPSFMPSSSSVPRPSSTPITTSTYTPPELATHSSEEPPAGGPLTCFCSTCGPSDTCRGIACANRVTYTESFIPDTEEICVTDTAACTQDSSNPDPDPGTVHVLCCDGNRCNAPLVFPTFPTPPATPTTTRDTTTRSTALSSSTSSKSDTPTSSSPHVSPASSEHLYSTLTVVVSVLSALIIVAVVAVLLAMLIHHIRKSRQAKSLGVVRHGNNGQTSRDCHLTSCLQQPPQKGNTPLSSTSSSASSSTTSSSRELHLNLDLKHLGTSV